MASERWTWGELFEVDVPEGWAVRDLDDVVELLPARGGDPIHLATLEVETDEGATQTLSRLVQRFAATHGVLGHLPVELRRERTGVLRARASFLARDGHWLVLGASRERHVILCTACGADADAPILELAEAFFDRVRVVDAPAPVELDPDPPGEF